jgi:hypothetical protein
MSDHINFYAAADGFVYFAIAEDPAARVAEMRPHCPIPIELLGGWILPPPKRAEVHRAVTSRLHAQQVSGEWFKVTREHAAETLELFAKEAGGKAWRLRKRPVTVPKPPATAREIVTPFGRFESAAAAARALGITRAAAAERAVRRSPGWRYADDYTPQPEPARRGRPPEYEYYDEDDEE